MAREFVAVKKDVAAGGKERKRGPELYQIVIECRDEGQQRELFERLKAEGVKVRLHVL